MSITARIAAGLFLLAGLLIGVLTYELSVVDRLQEVNRDLSRTNVEAARISVQLLQGLEGVREFAAKASALRDPEYRRQWEDWEEAVEEGLDRLAAVGLSGQEDALRGRIESGWQAYREVAPVLWQDASFLGVVESRVDDVRDDIEQLIAVNESTIAARVENSAQAGEEARVVAWVAAAAALLLAAAASLLLFLSISGPLRRLTRGTRELAHGRFDHRLQVSGPAELALLAADFNHMAARLDELEDLKRDFVSHVSHELKTPLAAIQETVEVLLDRLPGPLTPKQERLLELSRKSSARLSAMITDLLETSRLEAGAVIYHPGRHDLGEIARSVLDEIQPLAEEGGIALSLREGDGGMSLVCDDQRIGEVVANLVGNAVKFSPPRTSVAVELTGGDPAAPSLPPRPARTISSEHGPFLMISVSDEGPGVPDEHKEAIFNKFHQVERGTRIRGQGVGLGLAISRRIVESHGGAVWVEDRPGGGAVFKVVLPALPARWRGLVTGDAEQVVAPSTEARAALAVARGSSAHAVMLFLAVLPLAGCRVGSEPSLAPPSPELPAPDLEVAEAPEIVSRRVVPPGRERLDRAQVLLAQGSFEEAGRELQRVLELGPSGAERSDALWGMALVHLFPNSPLHDPDRGLSFLIALGEEFPASLPANQASWARLILEQLAGVRREAHAQQELLQELNEALEVLRQIDLDRRPSGAPRPDPGTAPRPGR